ncbi:MAG: hypothetical protein ACLTSG_09630 [Lachnospiraceae bacterium]
MDITRQAARGILLGAVLIVCLRRHWTTSSLAAGPDEAHIVQIAAAVVAVVA